MTTSAPDERERGSESPVAAARRGPLVAGLAVVGLAVVIAWTAAAGAPAQPELFGGGSCQFAPCGSLEDPARWRSTWWALALSAALAAVGVAVMASALPARPLRASSPRVLAGCLMLLTALPVALALAFLAALFGSVPVAVVLVASWAAGCAVVLHLVVFIGPASRGSVLVAAAACAVPFAALMAWAHPWTLG